MNAVWKKGGQSSFSCCNNLGSCGRLWCEACESKCFPSLSWGAQQGNGENSDVRSLGLLLGHCLNNHQQWLPLPHLVFTLCPWVTSASLDCLFLCPSQSSAKLCHKMSISEVFTWFRLGSVMRWQLHRQISAQAAFLASCQYLYTPAYILGFSNLSF